MFNFIHVPKTAGTSMRHLCLQSNGLIKYNGHGADVSSPSIKNQILIIRNPVDRFKSAVKYVSDFFEMCEETLSENHKNTNDHFKSIRKKNKDKKISLPTFIDNRKSQVFKDIQALSNRPNAWISILREDTGALAYTIKYIIESNVLESALNYIGPKKCQYIFPFEPQASWYLKPSIVIVMDNIEREVNYLTKQLGLDYALPHKNRSSSIDKRSISEKNMKWLQKIYAKDFKLYYNYSETNFKKRILNGI